jgi:hypothetical protein
LIQSAVQLSESSDCAATTTTSWQSAIGSQLPAQDEQGAERTPCPLLLVLDVTDDGFAYMGDKVIERPVFLLARVELAFQFGIIVLV